MANTRKELINLMKKPMGIEKLDLFDILTESGKTTESKQKDLQKEFLEAFADEEPDTLPEEDASTKTETEEK